MKCDYGEQISMLIDGELSAAESEKMKTHLAGCEDCRALERDFLFLSREIKKPVAEAIFGIGDARIRVPEKRNAPRRKFLFPAPALGLLALIFAALGIWYFAFYSNKSEPIASRPEIKMTPKSDSPDDSSLARFDKGGRAEIYVAPQKR